MGFWGKFIVVFVVCLFLCSAFVLADPPHKDNPGKGKKNPPVIDPVDNISIVWVSKVFNGFIFISSNDAGEWSSWSSWWTIWNILSDPPIINEGHSVNITVKYSIRM